MASVRHLGLGLLAKNRVAPMRCCRTEGGILRSAWKDKTHRGRGTRWQSTASSTPHAQPFTPPTPKTPLTIRVPAAIALTLLTFSAGFLVAGSPVLPTLIAVANPPSDAESVLLFVPPTAQDAAIEQALMTHPLTQRLLADAKFTAARPHTKLSPQMRAQSLTGGTLLGPNKLAVPPLQFSTADGSEFVSLAYLGPALCGHPGIVHGGLLATLLDEGLARCCFPALPNQVGVTASLNIVYKAPVMAGQIVVLRAKTIKVEGRKAWVRGWIETLADEEKGEKGVVLTEGEALFIEPRQAATMKRVVA